MTQYTLTISINTDQSVEDMQTWIDGELLPALPEDASVALSREDVHLSLDEIGPSQYGRVLIDPSGELPRGILEGVFPSKGLDYGVVIGGTLYTARKYHVVRILDKEAV